jgi:hypothetical protein
LQSTARAKYSPKRKGIATPATRGDSYRPCRHLLPSRASWPLIVTSACILGIGIAIPSSPLGSYLGFTPLPGLYWPLLALTLLCYVVLTQLVKTWLLRMQWI